MTDNRGTTEHDPGASFADSSERLLAGFDRISRLLDGYHDTLDHPSPPTIQIDTAGEELQPPETLPYAVPGGVMRDLQRQAVRIEKRVEQTREQAAIPRLDHLVETFDLADRHRDVLLLALMPTAIPGTQELIAELQNDLSATQPTVGMIADLFSTNDAEFMAATRLVGPESPLREHSLIEIGEKPETRMHRTERPVFVERRIEAYLLGHDGVDPVLANVLEEVPADRELAELRLEPATRERVSAFASEPSGSRLYCHGPQGTGKRDAARAIPNGDTLLRADLPTIVEAGVLDRLCREATLLDRPLHLTNATAATVDDATAGLTIDDIYERFESFTEDLIVSGKDAWTPTRAGTNGVDALIEFPRPGFELRREFWAEHVDLLPEDLDPTVLAGIFELTQGQLEAALSTMESLADGNEISKRDVLKGCSAQSADQLGDLAEELEPTASWDDIVLSPGTMRGLKTIAAHVRHKGKIYSEWAFQERFSRGTGVVAMFTGPSGTGKTMAAEIIANDIGMKLYKIDLSSVVSKYIGETEENLERIFTEAEHSNAILLFDEADAVFGDRAGVSDATDRYANVEVNYLLQRIESYNGVVLLTTNYESNIDSAFMRRIDHSVSFRRPDEEIRETIWRSIFPDPTPVEDLDYDFLASFEMSGGDIRTVAQTAAILAAADDTAVSMKHVVRALQRELEKSGTMVNPQEFEVYSEHLQLD